jgi:hypothetical protein
MMATESINKTRIFFIVFILKILKDKVWNRCLFRFYASILMLFNTLELNGVPILNTPGPKCFFNQAQLCLITQ